VNSRAIAGTAHTTDHTAQAGSGGNRIGLATCSFRSVRRRARFWRTAARPRRAWLSACTWGGSFAD